MTRRHLSTVALALLAQLALDVRHSPASQAYVPGDVIVTFEAAYMPTQQELSLSPTAFGISELDLLLVEYSCTGQRKFLDWSSPSELELARMFLLHFPDSLDVEAIRDELAELPCFSRVSLNVFLQRDYGGLRTEFPSTSTRFLRQWYYHDPNNDASDLDAPEAWAITKGDPDVVIAIHDSGIMVDDTDPENWRIHGDLRYLWTDEDQGTLKKLEATDLDGQDSSDPDDLPDNVIGYNFAPHWRRETSQAKIRFWHSSCPDWTLEGNDDFPTSMNCDYMNPHGTMVASIAAGLFVNSAAAPDSGDIVGMANGCSVYIVRSSFTPSIVPLDSEIDALTHAAIHADVINMSWGYVEPEDGMPSELEAAINHAAVIENCVLVAITHNDFYEDKIRYPAAYANVLAVGAIKKDLSLAGYSNYDAENEQVDVVAPVGSGIAADNHDVCLAANCPCEQEETFGNTGFGTSFAAPQVSGIAALIRSRFPAMAQDSVRARIKRAAEYYWASDELGPYKYGAGKVNAYRSVTEWGKVPTNASRVAEWGGQRVGWPDTLYIAGDLFIEAGDTLVLNRGTVVRVAPEPITHDEGTGSDPYRVEIIVRGTLRMGTTGTGPVIFESFTPGAPTATDWAGIRFEAGSQGLLRDVIIRNAQLAVRTYVPLTIDRCTISKGIDGIQAYANLTVKKSRIYDMVSTGIGIFAGSLTATNDTIYDCAYGINQSTATSTGAITISRAYLHDFDLRAINIPSPSGGVTIKRSLIEDANDGIVLVSQSAAFIDSCTVRNNDLGIFTLGDPDALIRRSRISGNTSTGIYVVSSTATLEADTVSSSAAGVFYHYSAAGTIHQNSRIASNTLGIKCDVNSSPTVRNSRITANVDGVAALNGSNPDLGQASGGTCDMGISEGRNSIHANTGYHVVNATTGTVLAECNWWDGAPSASKFSGSVDYTPYRSDDPNPLAPGSIEVEPGPNPDSAFPTRFDLAQNQPNPFNPVTTIRFDVPPPVGVVEIEIYDVGGSRVRSLVKSRYSAGTHSAEWNGRDDRGGSVASGVYFVRMSATAFVQTRKVVLLK